MGGEQWPQTGEQSHAVDALGQNHAHSARMYDYYLGGKTNYEVDRAAADLVIQSFPTIGIAARVNRSFMHRATGYLAAEHGIRQFLDVGTGIPTAPNLHEVAQRVAPDSRVVYADNDPIVLVHADALLDSSPEGGTLYVEADVTRLGSVLQAEVRQFLDLSKPVALSLNALLHFVPDTEDPYGIVAGLVSELAPGSFLVLSHCTPDFAPEPWRQIVGIYRSRGTAAQVRSYAEVLRFFAGLELVEPGLVVGHQWRPDDPSAPGMLTEAQVSLYAGVARKP